MYIRNKLLLFLSGFFIIILFFSIGSIFIFGNMNDNIELIKNVAEEHRMHKSIATSIAEYVDVVRQWALTGDTKYRKQHKDKREAVLKTFGMLDEYVVNQQTYDETGSVFDTIDALSKKILRDPDPAGNKDIIDELSQLSAKEVKIIELIHDMEGMSENNLSAVAKKTETIKNNISTFLIVLIMLSALATFSLITILKNSIGDPIDDIVGATDRISGGDLSFRIPADRSDEFGLLSNRFNEMIDRVSESDKRLKDKLNETELLLDIARIAGTATDLTSAFNVIVQIITERTRKDGCAIYTLRHDKRGFKREAASRMFRGIFNKMIPAEDIIAREAFTHLRPYFLNSDGLDSTESVEGLEGSLLSIPVVVDGRVFGIILIVSDDTALNQDDLNLFILIAHTIATAIKNIELHSETRVQLKRLSVLYELAKTVTSAITIDELFNKVTAEMTRLLSAKGCIIRLIENNRLPVKSSYGLTLETEKEMELEMGDGLAGWVAENGKPLLVEDASNMPEDMRIPVLEVRSVVCVPMKISNRIIGTIGLYDKKDNVGNITTFNYDDLSTAEGFASITAVAIDKIMTYDRERIQERAALEAKKRMELLFESV
ncbi:MAG: GAF domain-containing protein, partial [Thermodesulfovibrionales bacterium]